MSAVPATKRRDRTKFVWIFALMAMFGLFSDWAGPVSLFLLAVGLLIFLTILVLQGICLIFKKPISSRFRRTFLWVGLAGCIGLVVVSLRNPPPVPPEDSKVNEALMYMLRMDQMDLFSLRWFNLDRDARRLQRVLAMHRKELIKDPQDKFSAALILQHGTEPEHYKLAYDLAKEAAAKGISEAKWLEHAAYDRWQMSLGKPQLHGTQIHFQFGGGSETKP